MALPRCLGQVHRARNGPSGRPGAAPAPPPAHLSAPAAVSLTARLASSSSGPRRRTASRRPRPASAGRCCTSRASPAQAHSRTSALGCSSCGTGDSVSGRAGLGRSPPPAPRLSDGRAPVSPFLAAPPPARRPPLAQSRSPPLPARPDSRRWGRTGVSGSASSCSCPWQRAPGEHREGRATARRWAALLAAGLEARAPGPLTWATWTAVRRRASRRRVEAGAGRAGVEGEWAEPGRGGAESRGRTREEGAGLEG